jgi:hypothetical protein
MRVSLCYELISSAERSKQTARGRSTQCSNNSEPITSTSELLLRQNIFIAHAPESWARRLASDHCATENNRPKSAVRPIEYEVVGLERGPISLVSTIEELLGRKSSSSGLENRDYGRRGFAALTTWHPSIPQKLALTSPTSGGRSVCIVRLQTQATGV